MNGNQNLVFKHFTIYATSLDVLVMSVAAKLTRQHWWNLLKLMLFSIVSGFCVRKCKVSYWKERMNPQKNSGIQTQNLLNTTQTLLPLNYWTHNRIAKASLKVAKGLNWFKFQLSFSLPQFEFIRRPTVSEIPGWMGLQAWVYWLNKHAGCPNW